MRYFVKTIAVLSVFAVFGCGGYLPWGGSDDEVVETVEVAEVAEVEEVSELEVDAGVVQDGGAAERLMKMEQDVEAIKVGFKGMQDTVSDPLVVSSADLSSSEILEISEDVAPIEVADEPVKPVTPTKPVTAAVATQGDARVENIRLGEYSDKTRLVFDIKGEAEYSYSIDNSKNLLLITVKGAAWGAPWQHMYQGSKMVKAYAAKSTKQGDILIAVRTNAPSKVVNDDSLGKGASGYHRIFLDISAL